MIVRLRHILFMAGLSLVAFCGWRVYVYLFDTTKPSLVLNGVQAHGYYAGEIQCLTQSDKTGHLSISLDGKPVLNTFKIKANTQHQFPIDSTQLPNGKHVLRSEIIDTTYNQNKHVLETEFYVDNIPLQAAFVKSDGQHKVLQGRTLHVQFQVNKPIKQAELHALAHTYKCFPESKNSLVYECYIPVPCEEKASEYLLSLDVVDQVGNSLHLDNKFQVVMYPFKRHRLDVSDEKVKKEQELGADRKAFEDAVQKLTQESPEEKLWRGQFCTPIDIQRVTTEFGTIRTTQHKGRYAHKALDVINHPKSVVWSTQDGVVVMKERFADSGNTVIVDHGMGILSMYFHLDDFANIQVGDKVCKGNPVGTLGKTGYAKGYHLHWEMRINNVPVDPLQWTKATF